MQQLLTLFEVGRFESTNCGITTLALGSGRLIDSFGGWGVSEDELEAQWKCSRSGDVDAGILEGALVEGNDCCW